MQFAETSYYIYNIQSCGHKISAAFSVNKLNIFIDFAKIYVKIILTDSYLEVSLCLNICSK